MEPVEMAQKFKIMDFELLDDARKWLTYRYRRSKAALKQHLLR